MRRRVRLDEGWLFHRGELARPPGRGGEQAGRCFGGSDLVPDELPAGRRAAPDSEYAGIPGLDRLFEYERREPPALETWQPVRVPHDWRIEQQPSADGPLAQAFLPRGVAYYRLVFTAGPWREGDRVFLDFEGVMRDATVWCNGFHVGDHVSGYTPFRFDVTELLCWEGEDEARNVLLVRCDTTTPEGWWYEGGGIYRDAWLTRVSAVHVERDGIAVATPAIDEREATVAAAVTVCNAGAEPAVAELALTVRDPAGETVASASEALPLAADGTAVLERELTLPSPELWQVGDGRLYTLEAEVRVAGELVDADATAFGVRAVELRDGRVHVNGAHVPLRGVNLHQDFAGVGVALPARIVEHKLALVQEMGANAVRSAHHASSRAFLDAADRLGLLVIAENRAMSTSPDCLADLDALVREGRNHPSLFLWSLQNEEPLEGTDRGLRIVRALARRVRRLDPTRPLTVGGHERFEHPFYDEVDVVGIHYTSLDRSIETVLALRPGTPHVADEDGLFPTVRGQYEDDEERGLPSAFGTGMGLYAAMQQMHDERQLQEGGEPRPLDIGETWQWFEDHPEVAGAFVWTGIDYFGEPTPMRWPVQVSTYGAIDVCGFAKDYAWLLRSFFRPEPLVHLLPHWTWPGREGERLRVWAYTNCDEVELTLDGVVVGRAAAVNHIARWDDGIAYAPGTLAARGLRDGAEAAACSWTTAGAPAALRCTPRPAARLAADGHDAAVVEVEVVDAEGRPCPWADDEVAFALDGPGQLIGVGNGDPVSFEPHKGDRRSAFRGRCIAIVRALAGEGGTIELRATAAGLAPATARLTAERT